MQAGLSEEISEKHCKDYRVLKNYWVTSELRTYLRDLYVKIPIEYFLEDQKHYYFWSSDRFIMYALVELAGKEKILYIDYFLYSY